MGGDHAISRTILFDGVCNLCSAAVRFIIKRDPNRKFRFASLQSDFAKDILSANNLDHKTQTVVLIMGDALYFRSDAILEISRGLSGLWPFLYLFKIIPKFIRDAVYRFISQHRYQWFGKRTECWLPADDLNGRFL